jgi:ABC-type uncharacterized transport system ATPase subunit
MVTSAGKGATKTTFLGMVVGRARMEEGAARVNDDEKLARPPRSE